MGKRKEQYLVICGRTEEQVGYPVVPFESSGGVIGFFGTMLGKREAKIITLRLLIAHMEDCGCKARMKTVTE